MTMLTPDALTDDQIRELEVEAELAMDLEWVCICRRAYRHEGRGTCQPAARSRVVQLLNQRARWAQHE